MNTKHKQCTDKKTESITPEERTKGSDRYREDNQGGDVQVSVMRRKTMLTGVQDSQQPDDLEAGEGVYMTVPPPPQAASAARRSQRG